MRMARSTSPRRRYRLPSAKCVSTVSLSTSTMRRKTSSALSGSSSSRKLRPRKYSSERSLRSGCGSGRRGGRRRARNHPAAAAATSAASNASEGSGGITACGGSRARCGESQRTAQAAALGEQLGGPVDAPEEPGHEPGDERRHQRQAERRDEAHESQLDLHAPQIHGADQQRQQGGENDRAEEEETGHWGKEAVSG